MTLASFCGCAGRFESYLVENPEDRFSRDEAHIRMIPVDLISRVGVGGLSLVHVEVTFQSEWFTKAFYLPVF